MNLQHTLRIPRFFGTTIWEGSVFCLLEENKVRYRENSCFTRGKTRNFRQKAFPPLYLLGEYPTKKIDAVFFLCEFYKTRKGFTFKLVPSKVPGVVLEVRNKFPCDLARKNVSGDIQPEKPLIGNTCCCTSSSRKWSDV